jgi:hypothetical protein
MGETLYRFKWSELTARDRKIWLRAVVARVRYSKTFF